MCHYQSPYLLWHKNKLPFVSLAFFSFSCFLPFFCYNKCNWLLFFSFLIRTCFPQGTCRKPLDKEALLVFRDSSFSSYTSLLSSLFEDNPLVQSAKVYRYIGAKPFSEVTWEFSCMIWYVFGCHIDTTRCQMALNFQLVVSNQLSQYFQLLTSDSKLSAIYHRVALM